ncbi:16168_t:CDS:2 [Entrophospora sp. SA101]|nr:5953_t:CDS:2 [Entrophospora sp. SA101]CAJ0637269.1 16168_t:CDS:2 [Entrophospora sp. SA101]CAJ0835260.1 4270_t:CDS:2 [Entrophospora sp. SA101]CAJ0852559.1 1865_t:CDS:2 [Entrophospora sp. SA101]
MSKRSKKKVEIDSPVLPKTQFGKITHKNEISTAMEVDEKILERRIYLPGQKLEKDEVLEADQSVYEMLHSMSVKWPCLSFDILHDNLGEDRKMYPATVYLVGGTQADKPKNNELMIMKISQLHKTRNNPILEHKSLKHYGGVNRVRAMPQEHSSIVATWSDTGKVHIWDIKPALDSIEIAGKQIPSNASKPLYTVETHSAEGFAMDWSRTVTGRLITGDMRSNIYLTTKSQSTFKADFVPFVGHTASVEDLQWSPSENSVFASASVDKTIRIWDIRKKKDALFEYLIASGSDDGIISIWDLRTFVNNNTKPIPVASFKWHSAPITSIEWHPTEESVLGVSGADEQITIWDLSVENDPEEDSSNKIVGNNGVTIPSQLLFIHQGQNDIKELHWHSQISGCMISTAASGFNIFKTVSV